MGKYILTRLLKSIVSIFAVMSIVIVMIFQLIPRNKLFENDTSYKKLKGESKIVYTMSKYDELGYMDFKRKAEFCSSYYEDGKAVEACQVNGSKEQKEALAHYESKKYIVKTLSSGEPYVYHDYAWYELLGHYYMQLFSIDTLNSVQDEANPNLERKYYIGKNPNNGTPAIMCSGCTYKYQLYLDGSFPFVHQNKFRLNFGNSYPTNQGIPTLQVISQGQGSLKNRKQVFETGAEIDSPIIQTSCKYKPTVDRLDAARFTDNYADCMNTMESPSMINTSYLLGLVALIFAYAFGVPLAIAMARNKGKFADRAGIIYINILIAVPSLAFIFFMRSIGTLFGLPDKFPQLGFGDIRSYVMPILILGLLSTPALMMWVRRYMIDQVNADYVKFARAKGLSQKEIFNKHILRNAIIPIVNGIPTSVILCISGAFITESAFSVPGMGKMLPDAILQMNNNMIITLTFLFTALSILAVLLGDILMTLVDPRIQLVAKGGNN